jgi:hypothetical protein
MSCRLNIENIAKESNASREILGKSIAIKFELTNFYFKNTLYYRSNIFMQCGLFDK